MFFARSKIWSTSRCCSASSITCRITRRCRVRRMPRSPSVLMRLPVVCEVLIRSPVDARCGGVTGITFLLALSWSRANHEIHAKNKIKLLRRSGSGVNRNQTNDVIVHDVSEQQQKKHKSYLNEALLNDHAQVAAQQTFNRQQQNLPAIENRNRQQIQNSKIHADERHQQNHL